MQPISLYIHIPYCKSKCHYCAFFSKPQNKDEVPQYFQALHNEINSIKELLQNYQIQTIYFGGGTPSLVDPEYIIKTLNIIRKNFNIIPEAEITIESNPDTLTKQSLESYKNSGFNRISIGFQAWQNHILKYLGRTYTNEIFANTIALARQAGFKNINIDLIFGIPNQTLSQWKESLEQVIKLKPQHISCYSLELDKDSVFGKLRKMNKFQPADELLDRKMYHQTIKILKEHNYSHYEISNFAKLGYECQHNLDFWNGGEYIGFGPSASSYLSNTIITNISDTKKYISHFLQHEEVVSANLSSKINETHTLNPQQTIIHQLTLNLRLTKGIDIEKFNQKHNINITENYKKQLTQLESQNLIKFTKTHIKLTQKGLDLENRVIEILYE